MVEKSKKKRSPQDNIRPLIFHLTTSFIFLVMLIYTYIRARMPLDLTIVICLFQLICAGIFAGIGMTNSDWENFPLLTPPAQNGEQLPTFLAVLILLMTFFSACSVLAFSSLHNSVTIGWGMVLYLGILFLPYFIAREMFFLGKSIALTQQQKSKFVDEEDNEEVLEFEDPINDNDSHSYKEQQK